MPEDEEKTEGEDLFEDLDKFFAPIQDVDWPESSEPATPEAAPPGQPDTEPGVPDEAGRGSTMAFETEPEVQPEQPQTAPEAPDTPQATGELYGERETEAADEPGAESIGAS